MIFWRKLAVLPIVLYQATLSPDHSPFRALYPRGYCRFYPTCSEYCRQSILKNGLLGFLKGFWRLLRCHPWSDGGVDLP